MPTHRRILLWPCLKRDRRTRRRGGISPPAFKVYLTTAAGADKQNKKLVRVEMRPGDFPPPKVPDGVRLDPHWLLITSRCIQYNVNLS